MRNLAFLHNIDTEKTVLFLIAVFAVALSFKYFPGLENNQYYAGFTIQSIHPELLAKDPIVGDSVSLTNSPYKLTVFHLLPKIFGEIWLDDRFIAVLYIIAVGASFLAADRIAVTLGARGLPERLLILMMFLKDHQLLENSVIFAHPPDFHHSALAIPISLWLLYAALSGKGVVVVLLLSALLAAVSLQVAPYMAGICLIAAAILGTRRERMAVAAMFAAGIVVGYIGMFHIIEIPEANRVQMWDLLVNDWYEGMVAPFDSTFRGVGINLTSNVFFLFVFLSALLWPGEKNPAAQAARAVLAVGLITWLLLGLYGSYAPDSLKFPQLLLFPVSRQLQFPQVLAYIALMVLVFRWADAGDSAIRPRRALLAGAVVFALLLAGPGNFDLWTSLFAVSAAASVFLYFILWKNGSGFAALDVPAPDGTGFAGFVSNSYKTALTLAMAMTMTVAMSYAAWQKFPAWQTLFRTGIHGSSESAIWTGIAEYIRANTPRDAVILPLQYPIERGMRPGEKRGERLTVSRNLASRSGRAIPSPMMLSRGLNLEHFRFALQQRAVMETIPVAWMAGDGQAFMEGIGKLRPVPDYIIVPTTEAGRIGSPGFAFSAMAKVRDFTILQRTTPSSGGVAR